MIESCDWLPLQNTLTPPSVNVAVTVNVSRAYMFEFGVDVSAVLIAVKYAVAEAVNSTTGATLTVAAVIAAAAAVPGILEVRYATLDLGEDDVTAASYSIRPEFVYVYVGVIA